MLCKRCTVSCSEGLISLLPRRVISSISSIVNANFCASYTRYITLRLVTAVSRSHILVLFLSMLFVHHQTSPVWSDVLGCWRKYKHERGGWVLRRGGWKKWCEFFFEQLDIYYVIVGKKIKILVSTTASSWISYEKLRHRRRIWRVLFLKYSFFLFLENAGKIAAVLGDHLF